MSKIVSIIIPTYNGGWKLKRAIDSCLMQTYKNIQLIVVDDNEANSIGRKTTETILSTYENERNILYVKHERNLNGSAARNTGIKHSKGDYITFLDDDDFLLPNRIENSVEFLKNNPKYFSVLVDVIHIQDKKYRYIERMKDVNDLRNSLLEGSASLGSGSNLFFDARAIRAIGLFDERFIRFQDLEYYIRYLSQFSVGNLHELLIIKDSDGRNFPKYDKLYHATSIFLNKFEKIIDSYPNSKDIYANYYRILWEATFYNNSEKNCKKALSEYGNYTKISNKDKLKTKFSLLISKKNIIKKALSKSYFFIPIKKGLISILYRKMEKELDETIINYIKNRVYNY